MLELENTKSLKGFGQVSRHSIMVGATKSIFLHILFASIGHTLDNAIQCQKERCQQKYIGFTTQQFRDRMCQHLGYIRNKNLNKAIGEHFNLPGHSKNDVKFTIIEKVRSQDPLYGREREKLHIRKFNTFYAGINKEP